MSLLNFINLYLLGKKERMGGESYIFLAFLLLTHSDLSVSEISLTNPGKMVLFAL